MRNDTLKEDQELLTVAEVAKILRYDYTTINRWIRTGLLEAVKLPSSGQRQAYRVKRAVLNRLLEPKLQKKG